MKRLITAVFILTLGPTLGPMWSAGAAAAEPGTTFKCPFDDSRAGDAIVLRFIDGIKATLTIEGVSINDITDPVLPYTWTATEQEYTLQPADHMSQQMGVVRFNKSRKTLSTFRRRKTFVCQDAAS